MRSDPGKKPARAGAQPGEDQPGVLPLGSNAFRSPLFAAPDGAGPSGSRVPIAILSAAVLLSAGVVTGAWLARPTEVAVDGDGEPRAPATPPRNAAKRGATRSVARLPLPAAAAASAPLQPKRASTVDAAKPERPHAVLAPNPRRPRKRARTAHEATPPPVSASKLPKTPARADVLRAMKRITPAVHACFGDALGSAKVTFFVRGATGRVTTARVQGITGKTGSCVARAVRRARFPKFAKDRLEISYPFQH